MNRPTSKPRPWAREQPPRRATVAELLILSGVSLAAFAGVVALIQAYSFRDLHFAPRAREAGAAVVVEWRFFGVRVWQRTLPDIVRVAEKRIVSRGDFSASNPNPAPNVDILTVFKDRSGHDALTLRHTSLSREIRRMQTYLASPSSGEGLTVRETERWWASNPVSDLAGLAIGMLLGLAIGIFFFIGTISVLRVRLSAK